MISLFRKIRLSLLHQQKITQYLAYAIGEIFLVVIGILIALQINTWNEQKKIRQYEVKMLKELKSTLQKDRRYFSNQIPHLANKQKAANRLLAMLESKEENLDTLNRYFSNLRYEILFQYNSGAYGSIKSGGIDKISNDSIRAKMADLYEFLIPRSEKLFIGLKDSEADENELIESLTSREIIVMKNGEKSIQNRFSDPKSIYREEFLHLLQMQKRNTALTKNQMESLIPHLDELLELLDIALQGEPQ